MSGVGNPQSGIRQPISMDCDEVLIVSSLVEFPLQTFESITVFINPLDIQTHVFPTDVLFCEKGA
jgi:hypothetical protein